jgi:hypothetical protein
LSALEWPPDFWCGPALERYERLAQRDLQRQFTPQTFGTLRQCQQQVDGRR